MGLVLGLNEFVVIILERLFKLVESVLEVIGGMLQVGLWLTFGLFQQKVGIVKVGLGGAVFAVEDEARDEWAQNEANEGKDDGGGGDGHGKFGVKSE